MRSDRELLALHTKLALMWIVIGIAIGAAGCWFTVGPGTRPVVELYFTDPQSPIRASP